MEWMLLPYKKYAQFSGRSRRKEYWMFYLFYMVVYIVLSVLTGATIGTGIDMIFSLLSLVFSLGSLIPMIAAGVRRMHDVDKSGWFLLIPLYNLILAVSEGTKGPNRFGPDPKDPAGVEAFS